jgi:hypothetical protein
MTTPNPITPPPELVQQWVAEIWHEGTPVQVSLSDEHIATRAAQWGANQELEACCEYLVRCAQWEPEDVTELRAARRPRPPSLKERALHELAAVYNRDEIDDSAYDAIRRALEALPDD